MHFFHALCVERGGVVVSHVDEARQFADLRMVDGEVGTIDHVSIRIPSGNQPWNTMVVFKMRDSVPSARYSSVCNVLRQRRICYDNRLSQ